jgi:hypothetical protein
MQDLSQGETDGCAARVRAGATRRADLSGFLALFSGSAGGCLRV